MSVTVFHQRIFPGYCEEIIEYCAGEENMPQDVSLQEDRSDVDRYFPLRVYHNAITSGYQVLRKHWHSDMEILWVHKGNAIFQIGDHSVYASPGDILIVPGGDLHSGYSMHNEGHYHDAVVISPTLLHTGGADAAEMRYLGPLAQQRLELPLVIRQNDVGWDDAELALDRLIRCNAEERFGYELEVRGYLFVFIATLIRANAPQNRRNSVRGQEQVAWFKQVLDYVEAECHRTLRLGEIAQVANVSPHHLCHLFHRLSGRTLTEHVNLIRIQRARILLQETERKILDIATEVGFTDINHFLNLYKRYCHERPSDTRRNMYPKV